MAFTILLGIWFFQPSSDPLKISACQALLRRRTSRRLPERSALRLLALISWIPQQSFQHDSRSGFVADRWRLSTGRVRVTLGFEVSSRLGRMPGARLMCFVCMDVTAIFLDWLEFDRMTSREARIYLVLAPVAVEKNDIIRSMVSQGSRATFRARYCGHSEVTPPVLRRSRGTDSAARTNVVRSAGSFVIAQFLFAEYKETHRQRTS